MGRKIISCALVIIASLGTVNAQADTVGLTDITVNGDKMVNDSVLDVTWADINVFNGFVHFYTPTNGLPYSGSAQEWVANLNAANYGGFDDWRLANASGDYSSNYDNSSCNRSLFGVTVNLDELGCLFFNELGNTVRHQVVNTTPFSNLNAAGFYWAAGEGGPQPMGVFLNTIGGYLSVMPAEVDLTPLAVRTGQTLDAPPPVTPIPATVWLLISSIGGLGMFARRRNA